MKKKKRRILNRKKNGFFQNGHTMYGVNGEMLSKREAEVMKIIYALCHEKGVCLLSPAELLAQFSPKRGYTEEMLEKILGELALDDYFELL